VKGDFIVTGPDIIVCRSWLDRVTVGRGREDDEWYDG
jgi:hypothetical protein